MNRTVRHIATQRRFKAPEISGIRTRQHCGFFTPGFPFNGREGDGYKTRKGKKSA